VRGHGLPAITNVVFVLCAPAWVAYFTGNIRTLPERVCIPHPALQEFVLQFVTVDEVLPAYLNEVVTPYPPTPLQSLMFYGDDRIRMMKEGSGGFNVQPSIVVIGPQYSRVNIMVTKRIRAIRVDLKPGGLYRLLRIPCLSYMMTASMLPI
jgi:hypothetical protein